MVLNIIRVCNARPRAKITQSLKPMWCLVEIAVVVVAALVPMPVPRVVPLLLAASLSLWLRKKSFVMRGNYAGIAIIAGLAALGVAIVAGTPFVEALTNRGVERATFPTGRGSGSQLVMVAVVVGVSALASELVLHGWILERVI